MTNSAIDYSAQPQLQTQIWRRRDLVLSTIALLVVSALDFFTPPEYVLGFLYLFPLLLANRRLPQRFFLIMTGIIAVLMLLNLWLPNASLMTLPAIVNRLIAALSIIITSILSLRNATYAKVIANQQAEFAAQSQLASLREDFASTLTHDLKTPLLGAIATLNAFLKGQFGCISPLQTQVLSTMERSHKTSVQLLETLLDIYRNDATGLILHLEIIDLGKLVEETANQLAGLAHHRQIQITVCHGDSEFRRSFQMQADALQLQRVLMNLLVNAVNHSSWGDRVEVRLNSSGSHHSVQVRDQGAGLKPEVIAQLFQRFYQGNSDRQGSGLGLYLARQIITAHHGIIWAEPLSPIGAVVAFQIPISQPQP
jgi:two-component system, NarL family, sensor kinase